MNSISEILIAGGDMRQIYCALALSEKYDISVMGFDSKYIHENIKSDIQENKKYQCIILPVPAIDGENHISTPCFSGDIYLQDIKNMLSENSIIFAGKADDKIKNFFSDYKIYDYMEREELSLKNAVPTAEGAVKIALDELPVTLNGLKVLIVGMGRIGTALANILKGFGADVTAAVRNAKGAAKARIAGIKSVCTKDMTNDYGLVFNTAPSMIFTEDILRKFSDDTLFIDLASKPGGIDFDSAAELGKKVIWALGIPGKNAPVSAGKIIAETVISILSERGAEYE